MKPHHWLLIGLLLALAYFWYKKSGGKLPMMPGTTTLGGPG